MSVDRNLPPAESHLQICRPRNPVDPCVAEKAIFAIKVRLSFECLYNCQSVEVSSRPLGLLEPGASVTAGPQRHRLPR
jgi:hypothetical protein